VEQERVGRRVRGGEERRGWGERRGQRRKEDGRARGVKWERAHGAME